MAVKNKGFATGAAVGVAVAVAGAAGAGMKWPLASAQAAAPPVNAGVHAAFAPAPGAPASFADIFEKVAPAVVSIDVTSHAPVQRTIPGIEGLPFGFSIPQGRGGGDEEDGDDDSAAPSPAPMPRGRGGAVPPAHRRLGPELMASGSGFFISPDGYIVTNNHVIENAETIKVILQDKRELTARVIGADEGTDLAVLKVDGANVPYVSFENSAHPRVGDWVIAVGNPFNLGGTATAGIISAYGRDLKDSSSAFVDYLQIDAPINRGNSGGPTFDVYGRVIGVNTAIFSPSGGSVGIGFAVPADIADRISKQLIAGGKITRGYLGVTIQNITPEIADSLGLQANQGALIADVVAGGPASRAGVQQGDVVTAVDGKSVSSNSELTRLVASAREGEVIHLTVVRAGRPVRIDVRSGLRPSEAQLAKNDLTGQGDPSGSAGGRSAPSSARVLGLGLGPLDAATRRRFNIDSAVRGAVVESVSDDSDAGSKGVKRGDVVVRANDRVVSSGGDVAAVVADARRAGRTSVLLLVSREGRTTFLPVKIDK